MSRTIYAVIVFLHLLAICLADAAPYLLVTIAVLDGFLILAYLFSCPVFTGPSVWGISLLSYAMLSSILTGGIEAIDERGFINWIKGEGRFFISFLPFLAIMLLAKRTVLRNAERILYKSIFVITIIFSLSLLFEAYRETALTSSHHAKGALSSALFLSNYFFLMYYRSARIIPIFLISILCLIVSDSRTSVISSFLTVLLLNRYFHRPIPLTYLNVGGMVVLILMSVISTDAYQRLINEFRVERVQSMISNVIIATRHEPSIEFWGVRQATEYGKKEGYSNLEIRGYAWGKALKEGSNSLFFGTGFGRYNDIFRDFHGMKPLLWVASDSTYPSENKTTAHNSYLHIFSELGLVGLFALLFFIRGCYEPMRKEIKSNELGALPMIGFASLTYLCITALTQHAFGSPIYGFTHLCLVAFVLGTINTHDNGGFDQKFVK